MEQIAQETLTAQMPVQSNGGITSHEEVTGHNKGTRQEGSDSTQIPSAHEAGQRARVATATFGEIGAMLSFSPVYKHLSLADLEWLVIPALAINQVTVVRGKLKDQNGLLVPMGLALWAHVSEDVDKRLEAQQQSNIPFHLAPQDWKSGEIPWLLAVLAPKEVAQELVKKLEDSVSKDKTYKRYALTYGRADLTQSSPTIS
ncbi:toxin-activating lysine-acyltransferase [Candidatus Nitrospira neomarina]|uniref:RTX toxin-activating lysine-acyltransferase n=1 Tax=Candidatus Nitrospira neomarina TaxID=3020899 RepID=A0AA96GKL4_9BACT|nr:toxin-activating lysine-acyltransferase [Candidatus Nitrospira neomarina]WNM62095.1 toxin-activating lysine-acyltransferase [Candidatus Nitrospira neomarina]